jgi:non-heme chloroperoxidase
MGENAPGRLAVAAFCVLLFGQGIATSATAEEGRVTSHFIEISDTFTIHYETAGRGDITIVFIPGWTMTTRAFQHQLAHFAGSDDFTALTYDPRGQGLSTKTTEGHYYEQHGRDLHALIEALGLDRIVLAGWSYGTLDQLAYVDQFGAEKLVGLIMIDGTPKSKGTDFTKEWVWWGTKDEGDQDDFFKYFSYDLLLDRQSVNKGFAEWMLEDASPENVAFVLEMTSHTSDAVAALLNTAGWFDDYSAALIALDGRIPLLYVVREEWRDLAMQWASRNTPSAEVVAFGKHMMFWERPEEFNAVLDRYLEGLK